MEVDGPREGGRKQEAASKAAGDKAKETGRGQSANGSMGRSSTIGSREDVPLAS